jgi:ferritin
MPAKYADWFVKEQVEEETCSEIVEWLKWAGDSAAALFALNGVLAGRAG